MEQSTPVSFHMLDSADDEFRAGALSGATDIGGRVLALNEVIAHIDSEIATLQQAKALLMGSTGAAVKGRRGRPKGSKNTKTAAALPVTTGKRKLSPEGRKAIADAMKRRWAERRKTPAAK